MVMRTSVLLTTSLVAAFAASTAANAGKHATTTVDDYAWQDNGQALALHSETGGAGVVVTRLVPEPFHGLRRGDVLVAADGRPLHQVEVLMRLLRGRTTPLALRVQRGQRLATIVWSAADYRDFAPAAPNAPASPPHN
jgi:S1-C subfamily serine protease